MCDYANIMQICDVLLQTTNTSQQKKYHHNSHTTISNTSTNEETHMINPIDIENLVNYVQIWSDILEVDDVIKQFKTSDFKELNQFEEYNYLYNIGFFYVKVNPRLSPMEFFKLLTKIPFEIFRLPGSNQVSFAQLTQLFGEKTEKQIIQLMVLGDYFKFWILINPYVQMKKTHNTTKLLLSGMGNLTIYISPNFLKNCKEFIENIDIMFQSQNDSSN